MKTVVKVGEHNIRVDGRFIRLGRVDGEKYLFLDDPAAVIKFLRKCGTRVDLFTFMQRLPETTPRYTYPLEWDNFAALPVSTFDHWWNKQIGFKARNKAKQAGKKGVVLREIPFDHILIEGICKIYNESPVRQGKPFPHYGISLQKVREYAGTFLSKSVFIGAFFEGILIGFIKLTIDESGTQAGLMHIVSMIEHRDKAPTNALIAEAVRSCAERKVSFLVYSNFAYGKKQRDSLSDFKERNGFQRIEVPRYYVPLTLAGSVGFRMGIHRRLVDCLPEALMERLRNMRASWYARGSQSPVELS